MNNALFMRYSYLQTKNLASRLAKKNFFVVRQSVISPIKNNQFEKSNIQDLCAIYALLHFRFLRCNT